MNRRNKLIWLLVGCWLATACASVPQADFDDGLAAYERGDYATALWEWKPLAEQGDARAQYNLGVMYDHGYGVPLNDKEAVKWYRKAAEQGYASAQYNLGFLYYSGYGVPQDYVLAHMWFNIAASQGNETAIKHRGIAAKRMTREEIAEAEKLAREWKPKE